MAKKDISQKGPASGAITVDLERCLACRTCEFACAKVHAGCADIVEAFVAGVSLVPRVKVIAAGGKAVAIQCQHCEDAPCVTVCPSGALYKDEATGRTLTAPDKCIGCECCVVVCPFRAVSWHKKTQRIVKCDLCEGIIAPGEQPKCVSACPTRARRLSRLDELVSRRQKEAVERTIRGFEAEKEVSGR